MSAAADDGVVEHEEQELIHSVIEFGDTTTKEVMVPRPDMVTVDNDATVTAALDIAIEKVSVACRYWQTVTATMLSGWSMPRI